MKACTCKGVCSGASGLGDGWYCVLNSQLNQLEHCFDGDHPVTGEWLLRSGFMVTTRTVEGDLTGFDDYEINNDELDPDRIELRVYRESGLTCDLWINNAGVLHAPQTRGAVRRLCKALGIDLKTRVVSTSR